MKTENQTFRPPDHWPPAAIELFDMIRAERGITERSWLTVLANAVECWLRAESLRLKIEAEGISQADRFGIHKPHWAIMPKRQSRLAFGKLVASLPMSSGAMLRRIARGDES